MEFKNLPLVYMTAQFPPTSGSCLFSGLMDQASIGGFSSARKSSDVVYSCTCSGMS